MAVERSFRMVTHINLYTSEARWGTISCFPITSTKWNILKFIQGRDSISWWEANNLDIRYSFLTRVIHLERCCARIRRLYLFDRALWVAVLSNLTPRPIVRRATFINAFGRAYHIVGACSPNQCCDRCDHLGGCRGAVENRIRFRCEQ